MQAVADRFHDDIRHGEGQAASVECVRQSYGHEERHRRRGKRPKLYRSVLGVGRVQRPGELRPCPPNEPENEDRLPGAVPPEVVVQQPYDLRYRVHEHQVEEQFDERGALIFGRDERWFRRHSGQAYNVA